MEKKKKIALLVCIIAGVVLVGGIIMAGWINPPEEVSKQGITVVSGSEFTTGIYPGGFGGCCDGSPSCLIYEGLLTFDLKGIKGHGLAESWEMSPDGKVWTFHLRKGVKFHDGTDFDCEDVKFTCEWNAKHGLKAWWRGFNRVECPDKHTAKLVFDIPRFTLNSELALTENYIMSTTTPLNEEGIVTEAVGTGPFKLVSWSKSERAVLERNDDYWGGKPKLERVVVVVIPSPETQVMALEAGEVDVISCYRSVAAIPRLKSNPELEMKRKLGVGTGIIYMGTKKEPFSDVKVRKAINYAIDKEGIATHLLADFAVKADYMFSPAFGKFVNKDAKNYGYDPEKAKQLLKDARWEDQDGDGILEKDGETFSITITYPTNSVDFPMIAEYLQHQFKEVGIKATLNTVEYAYMRQLKQSGDFDLLLATQWFIPHDEPSNNYRGYFHSMKGRYHFLNDLEVDALIDKLDATGDPAERLRLHHELQKEILERAPVVYLYNYYQTMFMKNSVKNFETPVHSRHNWGSLKKVYIEKRE